MRIIDAHVHLLDQKGYLDKLLATMDSCGIEKCCLMGLGAICNEAGNAEVKAAFNAHPDRIIGTAFVRPGVDEVEKIVQAYEQGFRMIKAIFPSVPYDDRACFDLWDKACEFGLLVLFHTGVVVCNEAPGEFINSWYMHPMRLEPITREFPKLNIIIAHLGVHWNDSAAEVARMRPGVYVDLTGAPDGWRKRADRVGMDKWLWWEGAFDKVIFGTDVHYNKIATILEQDKKRMEQLGLPVETRQKILSGNIAKLLGID